MKQTGRSVIELLCVLFIVGILSLTTLSLYRLMVNRHEANNIYDEVQRKVLTVTSTEVLKQLHPEEEISFNDFEESPYHVAAYKVDETDPANDGAGFVVEITNITAEICRELLKKPYNTPFLIQVGEKTFDPLQPDYSVCDVFEEKVSFHFIAKAYAGEGASIAIPFPPSDSDFFSMGEKELCEKAGGFWIENGVNDSECCEKNYQGVNINGSDKQMCCPKGQSAYSYQEDGETISLCCNGEVYQSMESYGCCSLPNQLVGIVNGSGNACCPEGNTGYIRIDNGERFLDCCEGTPYIDTDGQYTCCSLEHNDVKVEGKCCKKRFTNILPVENSKENISLCCSQEEQTAYFNGQNNFCCAGQAYKPKDHYACCESFIDVGGIRGSFIPKAAIGAPDGQEGCCLVGDSVQSYWNGTEADCCIGTVFLSNQSKGQYDCCAADLDENENLKQYLIPTFVQGSEEGIQICCDTRFFGENVVAYMSGTKPKCCQGEIYHPRKGEYACCVYSEFKSRRVAAVLGAPNGEEICCDEGENGIAAEGFWDGTKGVCCYGTVYEQLTDDKICCEFGSDKEHPHKPVSVLGLPEGKNPNYQACCPYENEAYWQADAAHCCAGKAYQYKASDFPDKYACCLQDKAEDGTLVPERQVVNVVGAPDMNLKACCEIKNGISPLAYWNGSDAQCCLGEVRKVIGAPNELYYCCEDSIDN